MTTVRIERPDNRGLILGGAELFYLYNRFPIVSVSTQLPFSCVPGVVAAEVEMAGEWSYVSTPPYVFMPWWFRN